MTQSIKKAFPGCVVYASVKGKAIYNKAFGYYSYDKLIPVSTKSIFDVASITKIAASTVAVMKLYDEGKLDLNKKLGEYLPQLTGSNKAGLIIKDVLLHQAGLLPFISFYKETIATNENPLPGFFTKEKTTNNAVRVAEGMYLRNDWEDTILKRILKSPLSSRGKYVYSDNDFIFLGKLVEQISGMPLNEYVQQTFYDPLKMLSTGFLPRNRFSKNDIVPTEMDTYFRHQLLQADVHDEGAAMLGGVAGHAGLFSNAEDMAHLFEMLINNGSFNNQQFLQPSTINLFTGYHSNVSRRAYGFDKPEKDNATRKDPNPSASASAQTFGHTGFTGTCVWADPKYDLVYIFLSNRVNPTRENSKLSSLQIRGKIQDIIYQSLKN